MDPKISQRLLSNELHELLLQELDFGESQVNNLIDNISLSIILKTLKKDERIEFYKLISEDNYISAKILIKKEIPEFEKKLLIEIKKQFKEILK